MSDKLTSAVIGGLAGGLMGAVLTLFQNPLLNGLACLTLVLCGMVAVWHYTGEHAVTLAGKQGVGLGALAGAAGAVVSSLLGLFFRVVGVLPGPREAMEESGAMEQMEGPGLAIAEFMAGPAGQMLGFVIAVIFGVILGLIGGAIGAAVFKRGEQEQGA